MTSLSDAMKALFYFIVFTVIVLSQVYADVCDDAVVELQSKTTSLLNGRMMAYDNLRNYAEFYSKFKSQIASEPCAQSAIDQIAADRQVVKDKRIETISKLFKYGVKEEGGKDLVVEYDYLTGKSKKYRYEFEDVFSNGPVKVSEPIRQVEEVVFIPKKNTVTARAMQSGDKCSYKISQNETVNLGNVRNQDGVGWCYAYVASDLLSFKLKKKISAVSLYDSNQDIEADIRTETSAKGGDIGLSIDNYIAKKNGLCLEEDLPSNDFKFCVNKDYDKVLNNILSVVREKKLDEELNSGQCLSTNLNAAFPGINISLIRNYMNRYGTTKLVEYLYEQQCKKLSFSGIKINQTTLSSTRYQSDFLMKTIDDQIEKGNIAGIQYVYDKFSGSSKTGNHASIVVGRQRNPQTGTCEYLVRNSWGKDCEQKEGEGLTCQKKCDSNNDNCRPTGHFWVSESRLKESLLKVTYLQ